jgi:Trk K+ transport system NAD-binding subunit
MCAGFGRVGRIVGHILLGWLPFTALDINSEHVETVRRFGNKVYFGDVSQLDLMTAAKTDRARIFVLAIGEVEASVRCGNGAASLPARQTVCPRTQSLPRVSADGSWGRADRARDENSYFWNLSI